MQLIGAGNFHFHPRLKQGISESKQQEVQPGNNRNVGTEAATPFDLALSACTLSNEDFRKKLLSYALDAINGSRSAPGKPSHADAEPSHDGIGCLDSLNETDLAGLDLKGLIEAALPSTPVPNHPVDEKSDRDREKLWRLVLLLAHTATGREHLRGKSDSIPEDISSFLKIAAQIRKENPSLPASPARLAEHGNLHAPKQKDISTELRHLSKALNTTYDIIRGNEVNADDRVRWRKVMNGLSKEQEKAINKQLVKMSDYVKQQPVNGTGAKLVDVFKRSLNPKGHQNAFEATKRISTDRLWEKGNLHPEQMKIAVAELKNVIDRFRERVQPNDPSPALENKSLGFNTNDWKLYIRQQILNTLSRRTVPLVHGTCLNSTEKERLVKELGDKCIDNLPLETKVKLIDLAGAREKAKTEIARLIDEHNRPFDATLAIQWMNDIDSTPRSDTTRFYDWEKLESALNRYYDKSSPVQGKTGALCPSRSNQSDVYAALCELQRSLKPGQKLKLEKGGEQGVSTACLTMIVSEIFSSGTVRVGLDIPFFWNGATTFSMENTGSAMQYTIGWDEGTKKGLGVSVRTGTRATGATTALATNVGYTRNNVDQHAVVIKIPFKDEDGQVNRVAEHGLNAVLNMSGGDPRDKPLDRLLKQYPNAGISYVQGQKTEDTVSAMLGLIAGADYGITGNEGLKIAPRGLISPNITYQFQRENLHALTSGQARKDATTRASKHSVTANVPLNAQFFAAQRGTGGVRGLLAVNRSLLKKELLKIERGEGITLVQTPEGRIEGQKTVKHANYNAFSDAFKKSKKEARNFDPRSDFLANFIADLNKDKRVGGAFELNYDLAPGAAEIIGRLHDWARTAESIGDSKISKACEQLIGGLLKDDHHWHAVSIRAAKTETEAHKPWIEFPGPYTAKKTESASHVSQATYAFRWELYAVFRAVREIIGSTMRADEFIHLLKEKIPNRMSIAPEDIKQFINDVSPNTDAKLKTISSEQKSHLKRHDALIKALDDRYRAMTGWDCTPKVLLCTGVDPFVVNALKLRTGQWVVRNLPEYVKDEIHAGKPADMTTLARFLQWRDQALAKANSVDADEAARRVNNLDVVFIPPKGKLV